MMNLTDIAAEMKANAKAFPGAVVSPAEPLARGAKLRLKFAAESSEFRLQVQRSGTMPETDTARFAMWKRELQIFGRNFGAAQHARVEFQSGEKTYAAVIIWHDPDAELSAADIAEMEPFGETANAEIYQAANLPLDNDREHQ